MIENNSTNVFAAFEILLGEIEVEIDFCHKAGAEAFERRDLEDAREVLEYAGQIMVFETRSYLSLRNGKRSQECREVAHKKR
jgi:hypothetical protein